MDQTLHGKCHCKQVNFFVQPPLLSCGHCHCESCRRSHAAPFVTWTSFKKSQVMITAGGTLLTRFESSPGVVRSFCSICGTHLFYESKDDPGTTYSPTVVFGDEIGLKPTRHVSFEEKVPWLEINDRLEKYSGKTTKID